MGICLHQNAYRNIAVIAFCSRVAVILLGYFASLVFERFDKSTELSTNPSIFKHLLSWDALHILHIADRGYTYEHSIPFFPLLPMILRCIPFSDNLTKGVICSNLFFIISAMLLYKITLEKYSHPIAFLSTVFFIFNPASVIYSGLYTESLFCLLFLMSFRYLQLGNVFRAATFIGLCGLTRSNSIIFVIFFKAIYFPVIIFPFAFLQLWHLLLVMRQQCSFRIFVPYSYVQRIYWNQGFLRFFTVQNIPNVFFGIAPICHSVYIIKLYVEAKLFQFFTRLNRDINGVNNTDKNTNTENPMKHNTGITKNMVGTHKGVASAETFDLRTAFLTWCNIQIKKYKDLKKINDLKLLWYFLQDPFYVEATSDTSKLVIILALQIIVLIFFVHWNIAYRFISFNPFLYWSFAFLSERYHRSLVFQSVAAFHFSFGIIYTILFSVFYPPA